MHQRPSALLEFYYYSDNAKRNIFDAISKTLKGRLWIPSHAAYEYQKNRNSTIRKLYLEKYDPLEKDSLQSIQTILESMNGKITDFQNKTMFADTHPFVIPQIVQKFGRAFTKFNIAFKEFETGVKQEFEKRRSEIGAMSDSDTVLSAVKQYFDIGDAYDFERIMEIVAEGEIRYRNEIPPGYKDAKPKEGTQKYGDLIIWKQIIDYAKKTQKSIIFVTNDIKEDWVYVTKKESEKKIERPREDLIKEIRDQANVAFWMYTFSDFLYMANERLDAQIDIKVIQEVERVTITKMTSTENEASPLSPREREVLEYMSGYSNKEIARSLGISHQTVKNHVTAILSKLGVQTRTQAPAKSAPAG